MIGGIGSYNSTYNPAARQQEALARQAQPVQEEQNLESPEKVESGSQGVASEEVRSDSKKQRASRSQPGSELTPEEQKVVQELVVRDREVRAHEQAHKAAAGRYAVGGANYAYQVGPDGKRYAVGGDVSIDTSPVPGDPQATIEKAQQLIRAALAPAQPSNTDRAVASQLQQVINEARAALNAINREESQNGFQTRARVQSSEDGFNVTRVPSRLNIDRQAPPSGIAVLEEVSTFNGVGGELVRRGGQIDAFV